MLSTVPAAAAGQSLLARLTERFRYFDAAGWSAAIDQGRVQRNGATAPADTRLAAGDTIGFTPPPAPVTAAIVPLLHHDDDLLLVGVSIGPAPHRRIAARRTVVAAGSRAARTARTTLAVQQHLDGASLLRVTPHTGRTHQIRLHPEHLGHPCWATSCMAMTTSTGSPTSHT